LIDESASSEEVYRGQPRWTQPAAPKLFHLRSLCYNHCG